MNYYNEFDPKAAQWLRNLIEGGKIPLGHVDERSITEVDPDELRQYTQCHFFAGIGGWSYALKLALWPDDRPVWTGSCPCQPFSSAGKQKGKADDRHLWPVWFRLIQECRPATVFGEQVASAIAHGWLDDVYQGLEAEGYAVGSAVLPACSVGAPHKRDRLWFVANAQTKGSSYRGQGAILTKPPSESAGNVANAKQYAGDKRYKSDLQWRRQEDPKQTGMGGIGGTMAPPHSNGCKQEGECQPEAGCNGLERNGGALGNAVKPGSQGHARHEQDGDKPGRIASIAERSAWQTGVWIDCPDGKQRLVEPSIPLLANGVSGRVVKLRALGNAIVPQVAATFIEAYMGVNYAAKTGNL